MYCGGMREGHMTEEVFGLLKKMDIRAVETQMALRCAPFIAGLKTSNLLIVENGQAAYVRQLLRNTRFSWFCLHQGEKKTAMLLYTGSELEPYLEKPEARIILCQQGYRDVPLQELLQIFAARYQAYMRGWREFPHEIGLFLGYPAEDVKGFMENGGKHFLCAGYWKVYGNAGEKLRLFQKFDQARERLVRLIADGICMEELLRYA